jgi:glycosyltransferase involved in cell wall biosynthesis
VDEQARRLADAGCDVVVVVLHADLDQPLRPYRLVVIERDMRLSDYRSRRAFEKIAHRYELEGGDLWILHTPPFYSWSAFIAAPVILVEYGGPPGMFFPPDVGEAIDTTRSQRFLDLYGRLMGYDAVVSISQALHDELPETARRHSSVNLLGGDHYPPVTQEEARSFRLGLGVTDDECLILWVGRMQLSQDEQPYKGFSELLKLIPVVRRRAPRVRFVLAGRVSQTDRGRLERDGLIVLANQSREDLATALAAADILLNLSLWEGFNLALLEAEYQGTPVVAYDFGPHCEIVRDGSTGRLVKTPRELLETVVRLARDGDERRRLGLNARAFAQSFTWEGNAQRLINVVERCLDRAPSRAAIALQRAAAARASTPADGGGRKPTDARTLLGLDRAAFLSQAAALVPTGGLEALNRDRWSYQLATTGDRRAVLVDIVSTARILGAEPRLKGLGRELLIARLQRAVRRTKARGSGLGAKGSPWRNLNTYAFAQFAHRVILGREPDQATLDGLVQRLAGGEPRASLLADLSASPEARSRTLVDPELLELVAKRQAEIQTAAPN